MTKYYTFFSAFFVFIFLLFFTAPTTRALELNIVYPDDANWQADLEAGGVAEISADNARGNDDFSLDGNASLALKVTTESEDVLDDWAFYVRNADDSIYSDWTLYQDDYGYNISTDDSWGLLSDITALSFDWFRETSIDSEDFPNLLSYDPFFVQTPVLRLLIGELIDDVIVFSELVWELYYTDSDVSNMTVGEWVSEDLYEENFWRHYFAGDTYTINDDTYGYVDIASTDLDIYDTMYATTLLEWDEIYAYDTYVYGLSVGAGNMWPSTYTGYADNILLAFNDEYGVETGIYDNFELPASVPEPTTLFLFASGMGVMALSRRQRKKESKS